MALIRARLPQILALSTGAYLAYYLIWRATSTLNPDVWVFSLLVLAVELHGFIDFLSFAFMTWDVDYAPTFKLKPGLKVDVYVPTYNEGVEILEATLAGCNAITYPHQTYLLDDGRRDEVRDLAARFGVGYLTRPDNSHAKAGNINAALGHTDGDFIAILDCDTVPQPDFLDKTLGYFADEKVCLVQGTQEFYNADSVQHAEAEGDGWHEQALFFRIIQKGKNRWNAAFWCGSPSIVRRAALEQVGGVATDTVTEDIHTCIRMQMNGWKTVFHADDTLAYGIAPQSLTAFSVQRLRWAQGNLQVLRTPENPMFAPNLSFAQRVNYFFASFHYFSSFQKLACLLIPSIVLLFNVFPVQVNAVTFMFHWVPMMALCLLANAVIGRGAYKHFELERFAVLKMFTYMWASTILFFPRKLKFAVTPKSNGEEVAREDRRLLFPHYLLIGTIALSLIVGCWKIYELSFQTDQSDMLYATLYTLGWAVFNAILVILGIVAVVKRRYYRADYRFPARAPIAITTWEGEIIYGRLQDLSVGGAGVEVWASAVPGPHIMIRMRLPEGRIALPATVTYSAPMAPGQIRLGLSFDDVPQVTREALLKYLFVELPRRRREGSVRKEPLSTPAIFNEIEELPRKIKSELAPILILPVAGSESAGGATVQFHPLAPIAAPAVINRPAANQPVPIAAAYQALTVPAAEEPAAGMPKAS